ncbi:ShlB/FhaC/HecB family hemolysin secretion/activation protein [Frateuria defendens]|uniref:ShlB/FhaC/HecB family hemolysin secretion/activation protein n=1 Tax=Frateuria defendens TaxID=2219559 RepID=UPI00066FE792|nr:ShlB/FhaC/HecB family hemolysin secretion/activation protein [Frateuria defendens]
MPSYLRHRLDQDRVALSLSYPLLLSTTRSLVLGGDVYGSDQHDSYFNRINGARLVLQTDVRVLHSELDYTQASTTQVRKLGLGIGQGFDAWGAQSRALTNIAGASLGSPSDVRFTRYNLNASQSDRWGAHVGTVLSLAGQYSRDHLPSTEQISFGGPRYGLAYDPGSISGDSGWGAALEVNRPFAYGATWLKALVPYAVAQQARVYLNGSRPQLDTLQSMALGLRLSDNRHYTVDVSAAQPLGELPANQRHREPRYGLSFSYQLR